MSEQENLHIKDNSCLSRKEIEDRIRELLIQYGPDGHIDGYEEITDYIS